MDLAQAERPKGRQANWPRPKGLERSIRLKEGRFRIELQEAISLPKNELGKIDIDASTQIINSIVESWIREYPAQWLWLHNRWRGGDD